jgi:hypothetical protein
MIIPYLRKIKAKQTLLVPHIRKIEAKQTLLIKNLKRSKRSKLSLFQKKKIEAKKEELDRSEANKICLKPGKIDKAMRFI